MAGKERKRLGAEEAKPREHKNVLAAGKSSPLPMEAMKLEVIGRHRDSIRPREALRGGGPQQLVLPSRASKCPSCHDNQTNCPSWACAHAALEWELPGDIGATQKALASSQPLPPARALGPALRLPGVAKLG